MVNNIAKNKNALVISIGNDETLINSAKIEESLKGFLELAFFNFL